MRKIADGLWVVEVPFSMAGLQLGARMTVVALPAGGLLLHAPVAFPPGLDEELERAGEVRHIVAPNLMHHLHLRAAHERHPRATLHAPAGLEKKRPELTLSPIDAGPEAPWSGVLDQLAIEGMPALRETVFLHSASRTLICTDLVFHFREAEGLLTRLYLRASGALGRMRQTRILRSLVKDRAATRRSLDRVLAWDFDRVVMAHGQVLETGGKEALRDATSWI